jgi:hypothetical protein
MRTLLWSYLGWRRFSREMSSFEVREFFTFDLAVRQRLRRRFRSRARLGAALQLGHQDEPRVIRTSALRREEVSFFQNARTSSSSSFRLRDFYRRRVGGGNKRACVQRAALDAEAEHLREEGGDPGWP